MVATCEVPFKIKTKQMFRFADVDLGGTFGDFSHGTKIRIDQIQTRENTKEKKGTGVLED